MINITMEHSIEHGRVIIRELTFYGGVTIQTIREDGTGYAQDIENGVQGDVYDLDITFKEALIEYLQQ